jgi:hypothetical protein
VSEPVELRVPTNKLKARIEAGWTTAHIMREPSVGEVISHIVAKAEEFGLLTCSRFDGVLTMNFTATLELAEAMGIEGVSDDSA